MKDILSRIRNTFAPTLSQQERAAMHDSFTAYMEMHPGAPSAPPKRSPYFSHLAVYAGAALLFIGTPTLYASEHALPNEFLYPLKVQMVEPLVVALASVSDTAAADVSGELVSRRLAEAQALIEVGGLDTETAAELTTRITSHLEDIETHIVTAGSEGDLSEALDTGSDIESVLDAHTTVLNALSNADQNESNDEGADQLVDVIEEQRSELKASSDELEDTLTESVTEETEEYLASVREDATESLAEAREAIALGTEPDSPLYKEAVDTLARAEDAYDAAQSSERAAGTGSALSEYRDALQSATETLILLESLN